MQQNHSLVQHLIVFQIVQQGERNTARFSAHVKSGARHTMNFFALQILDEHFGRNGRFFHAFA